MPEHDDIQKTPAAASTAANSSVEASKTPASVNKPDDTVPLSDPVSPAKEAPAVPVRSRGAARRNVSHAETESAPKKDSTPRASTARVMTKPAVPESAQAVRATVRRDGAVSVPSGGTGEKNRRGLRKIRRWMKKYAFTTALVLPTVLAFIYFLMLASPMYVSHASFAIRSSDASSSAGMSLASMFLQTSGSTGNDAYIINDYIQSLDLARDIDRELSLVAHYSSRDHDVISRLWQSPTQDELARYWRWAVVPQLNVDTGIISLEVKAYSPEMAQKLTQAVLTRSEALVNAMNERARHDAVELAREEVSRAEERVRHAQSAMREFRDAHNLIDPKMTAEGLQSLVSGLEAEATTLRTQISEAKSYMNDEAPLLKSLRQRLAAVEKQLQEEKLRVAGQGSVQDNLNSLVADYEDLVMEAEFAQKQLVSAMTSLEQARVQQMAQSRYVVAYQQPTLPDESLYPRPFLFTLYVFAGLLLFLGIVSLVWASIREHAGF